MDVGGQPFHTTPGTIDTGGSPFLWFLLSGIFMDERDEHGYVFIDRDPLYFTHILDYMRHGEMCGDGGECEVTWLRGLYREACFFSIDSMEDAIQAAIRMSSVVRFDVVEGVEVQQRGRLITSSVWDGWGWSSRSVGARQSIVVKVIRSPELEIGFTTAGFTSDGEEVSGRPLNWYFVDFYHSTLIVFTDDDFHEIPLGMDINTPGTVVGIHMDRASQRVWATVNNTTVGEMNVTQPASVSFYPYFGPLNEGHSVDMK